MSSPLPAPGLTRLDPHTTPDLLEALRRRDLAAPCLREIALPPPGVLAEALCTQGAGMGDVQERGRDLVRSAYTLLLIDRGMDAVRLAEHARQLSASVGDTVSQLQACLVAIDALVDVDRRRVDDLLLEASVLAELTPTPTAMLKVLRRGLEFALRDDHSCREVLGHADAIHERMGRGSWPLRWRALRLWAEHRRHPDAPAFVTASSHLVAAARGAPAEVLARVHLTLGRASIDAGEPALVLHHAATSEFLASREGHRRTARQARQLFRSQRDASGGSSDALVRLSAMVAQQQGRGEILQAVASAAMELLPIDRCFVLVKGPDGLTVEASLASQADPGEPSWSVVRRAARTGEEVFTSDVASREELAGTSSLVSRGVHTVLCVPLLVGTSTLGVIYSDAAITARQELTQSAWQLRTLASQATQALHQHQLLEESHASVRRAREVAHDVRNLLAALDGGVEFIGELIPRGADDDGVLSDMNEGIRRAVGHLQRLLDGTEMPGRRLDLRAVTEEAAGMLRHQARRAGVEIRVSGPPVAVTSDADDLARAVFNLLGNALKYSPPHDVVRARLERDGVWAVLRVEDRGRGLPEGLDPFQSGVQGPEATQGYGLGLGIVAGVVEQWHGKVRAYNGDAGGAVFEVRLPAVESEVGQG